MASGKHVLVIGAGVTGLTSAWFLAEAGYRVTVIAAHVPGDKSIEYTSPWAGAHWRTHAKGDEPQLQDWDVQTYKFWMELLEKEKKDRNMPKAGVKLYPSYHLWEGPVFEDLWWATKVKNFAQLSTYLDPVRSINDRTPEGKKKVENAATDQSFALNVPQYLLYLQSQATSKGAKVIKARLPVHEGLEAALRRAEQIAGDEGRGKVDVFLNATGLGAAKLCNDEAMYPIRGQTVLVKGEAEATVTRIGDGWGAYCIPRPGSGTTILGGTKEPGNWSEDPDPETTKRILDNCAYFAPELLTAADGGFEVVSVQCGLRPGRTGGPRMEKEVIGVRKVVHAYGHASGGYQNSVGSARAVVKLVGESLGASNIASKL